MTRRSLLAGAASMAALLLPRLSPSPEFCAKHPDHWRCRLNTKAVYPGESLYPSEVMP